MPRKPRHNALCAFGNRLSITLMIFALASFVAIAIVHAKEPLTATDRFNEYMNAQVELGRFSGVVRVSRGGGILFEQAYGFANAEHRVPNRLDTRFAIASLSKQFTAAAVLKLRDEGKLKLEDSVCHYVTTCPAHWQPVSLRHLLTHTSGIADYEAALELGSPDYLTFVMRPNHVETIVQQAQAKPLEFEPGSMQRYSNTGYILLSKAVTAASGAPFERHMNQAVLQAAGLLNTGLLSLEATPRLAGGYALPLSLQEMTKGVRLEDAKLIKVPLGNYSGEHGDGNLYTTVDDLDRWISRLMSGRTLGRASLSEMLSPVHGAYGMGWMSETRWGTKYYSHNGVLPGYVSRVEVHPSSDLRVIVLSNLEGPRFAAIARDLAAIALDKPYSVPSSYEAVEITEVDAQKLLGDYRLGTKPARVTWTQGMVAIEVPNEFTVGLVPTTSGDFWIPRFDGVVRFESDDTGRVVAFTLHSQGNIEHAMRGGGAPLERKKRRGRTR